ncbi:GNAT family N-acetyltransferase [Chitinophagaceae bacterium LWZ2-11]
MSNIDNTVSFQIKNAPIEAVWQMRRDVMYPAETIDFVKLKDDSEGEHLGLYIADELVSIISIFIKGDDLQFRKFAVKVEMQGKGYGTKLLQHIMQIAVDKKCRTIWCNARTSALGLYKKFGMEQSGEIWQQYGIDFVKMVKQLN